MKQQLLRTCIALLLLAGFMAASQPDKLPVLALIVPFILIFAALYQTWMLLQALYIQYVAKNSLKKGSKRFARIVCASMTLLLVLQSLGQLTFRDIATVLLIGVVGYLYVARNRYESDQR